MSSIYSRKMLGVMLCLGVFLSCMSAPGATNAPVQGKTVKKWVTIPKLVGMSRNTAWTTLNSMVLKPVQGKVVDADSFTKHETVAMQSPRIGATVEAGSTVTLDMYCWYGVAVPNVVGMKLGAARKAIEAIGLSYRQGLNIKVSDGKDVDYARSQQPAAGMQVKKGTTVTVDRTVFGGKNPR
jgi:serine/threonine-protein kinase